MTIAGRLREGEPPEFDKKNDLPMVLRLQFSMRAAIKRAFAHLDDKGSIVSTELLLLATVLILGLISGIAATRDAVVSELADVGGALQDFNQCFEVAGIDGHSATIHGSHFQDAVDFCDSSEDQAGSADNCVTFNGSPLNEADSEFVLSEAGTFDFEEIVTGSGGSASGTIGDGTIDTGFTVTTDTGNIAGTTGDNQVRFRENVANEGTFTITYDEPLTEFEFFIRDLANIDGSPENLLGNFKLTLSDGTVIPNAPFSILPDAIGPNQTFGFFETRGNDNSQVISVNRGGSQFVTDPLFNGLPDQSAGRLVFPSIPILSNPLSPGSVGLQSIMFDRFGGPNGFQATFSTSGRVLRDVSP